MDSLPKELRALALELNTLGQVVDSRLIAAQRQAIEGPRRTDERETQKLSRIASMLWQLHDFLVRDGIPAADKLAATEETS